MRIIVFGDSIAEGLYDGHGGWVSRLAGAENSKSVKNIEAEKNWVINASIKANTLEGVMERFAKEYEVRVKPDDKSLVLLAIGINDAALRDNLVLTDEFEFAEKYGKLIEMAYDYTDNVLAVGLTAVDEEISENLKHLFADKTYPNNRINLFEDCIKQVCFDKSVPFLPIHDDFLKTLTRTPHLLSPDGLHPGDNGHKYIFERVSAAVNELLAETN
ncbi:MAG: GDSL-type esterase/lipase family protein [bacterium]|nr:GDSL-type esterase/lipase family protein [bacterium]